MNGKRPRIVNLTPHEITIFLNDNVSLTLPPSGRVARVRQVDEPAGHLVVEGLEVPLVKTRFGRVEGLPSPGEADFIVVSALVAEALKDSPEWRGRVLVPNTGPTGLGAVRDEKGRIRGVRSLILAA